MNQISEKVENFYKNLDSFVAKNSSISKLLKDVSQYDDVRENVKKIAEETFPHSSIAVHFYGSRVIGVATNESDLDMFIDVGGKFHSTFVTSEENEQKFKKFASAVELSSDWKVNLKLIEVPIPVIKAVYLPKLLECDMIMTNGLSTRHSKLLAHFFEVQPEAVKFFHFIKEWLLLHDCKFQGYLMTLLVVFYLQSIELMPSVETAQDGLSKEMIDVWQVQLPSEKDLKSYGLSRMESFKEHISGFFKFYSNFEFKNVMSTYHAVTFPAETYKVRFPKFRFEGVYIVGPFNHGKNCGVVEEQEKQRFIELCKHSSNKIF